MSFSWVEVYGPEDKLTLAGAMEASLMMAGWKVMEINHEKPWGIEFKIANEQSERFLEAIYGDMNNPDVLAEAPYGPKILVIQGGHRLSWHVHERKDAYLRVLHGTVSATLSETDEETDAVLCMQGVAMQIPEMIRHRLGGHGKWTIVAEISRNVDPDNPSDDDDERRISDDYGRV